MTAVGVAAKEIFAGRARGAVLCCQPSSSQPSSSTTSHHPTQAAPLPHLSNDSTGLEPRKWLPLSFSSSSVCTTGVGVGWGGEGRGDT